VPFDHAHARAGRSGMSWLDNGCAALLQRLPAWLTDRLPHRRTRARIRYTLGSPVSPTFSRQLRDEFGVGCGAGFPPPAGSLGPPGAYCFPSSPLSTTYGIAS